MKLSNHAMVYVPCLLLPIAFLCIYLEAAPKYSTWSAPESLGQVVNSSFDEFLPGVSKDDLSLYFTSDRPGLGDYDIWVTQRPNKNAPWGAPLNLGVVINTEFAERTPSLSRDGHVLFFVSNRPGGLGGLDIWASWRRHTDNDFSWEAPQHLGEINSEQNDVGPAYFQDDDSGVVSLYFASNRPGGFGGHDIYVSTLTEDGRFGAARLISELSSPQGDLRPAVRHDGLEVFLSSTRVGTLGGADLWVSTRKTVHDAWSTPVNLGPAVNSTFEEAFPSLSSDGKTLYFNSDRTDNPPSEHFDLYRITRTKIGQQ